MRQFLYTLVFMVANFSLAAQSPQPVKTQLTPVNPSDCLEMTVLPGSPSIITADFQYSNSLTIAAPWFGFAVNVNNRCTKPVTIIALDLHVTGKRSDGSTVSKVITISPSLYNFTQACSGGSTQEINFTDFGLFQPGMSGHLSLTPRYPSMTCGSFFSSIEPLLYAGGNPSVATDHIKDYNLDVQLTPVGWFGTPTEPDERLDKNIHFVTQ